MFCQQDACAPLLWVGWLLEEVLGPVQLQEECPALLLALTCGLPRLVSGLPLTLGPLGPGPTDRVPSGHVVPAGLSVGWPQWTLAPQ